MVEVWKFGVPLRNPWESRSNSSKFGTKEQIGLLGKEREEREREMEERLLVT
jgi:hypothetical protein